MQFELTKEYLDSLELAIEQQDREWIRTNVLELHYADIAGIICELNHEDGVFLYDLADESVQGDILMELDEDLRELMIKSFSTKEIAEQLELLDSDDAADLILSLIHI